MEITRGCGFSQFSVCIWKYLTFDHLLAIYVCVMSKLRLYALCVVLLHSLFKYLYLYCLAWAEVEAATDHHGNDYRPLYDVTY
jgi:hypothetical protein